MARRNKVTLNAQVAAADDFGRFRFLLLDSLRDGRRDYSGVALKNAIQKGPTPPYKFWECRDGVVGEFWTTPPKKRAEHWKEKFVSLRGKEVTVVVATRKYSFIPRGSGERITGISLDLIDLEELISRDAKSTEKKG